MNLNHSCKKISLLNYSNMITILLNIVNINIFLLNYTDFYGCFGYGNS